MTRSSSEIADLLANRRATLVGLSEEREPVLRDFADRLSVNHPELILSETRRVLPEIASFLRDQQIEEQDRPWLISRVAYLLGQLFAGELAGSWHVNEIPGSRYFARIVVGNFSALGYTSAQFDPFEAAAAYVDTPRPRELESLVQQIGREMLELATPRVGTRGSEPQPN